MEPPFLGSRAERSLAKLMRSAAVRGQSPREEGVQGEETHNLWTSVAGPSSVLDRRSRATGQISDALRPHIWTRRPDLSRHRVRARVDHAIALSASAGILYPMSREVGPSWLVVGEPNKNGPTIVTFLGLSDTEVEVVLKESVIRS